MGRRHLTTTAVAAGIGTAFTLALVPFTSTASAGHSTAPAPDHVISSAGTVAGPAPSPTPYVVGGAGFLLAGAGMVVVIRRQPLPAA